MTLGACSESAILEGQINSFDPVLKNFELSVYVHRPFNLPTEVVVMKLTWDMELTDPTHGSGSNQNNILTSLTTSLVIIMQQEWSKRVILPILRQRSVLRRR